MTDHDNNSSKELDRAFRLVRRSITLEKIKCRHTNVAHYSEYTKRPVLECDWNSQYEQYYESATGDKSATIKYGCICRECGLMFQPTHSVLSALGEVEHSRIFSTDSHYQTLENIQWLEETSIPLSCSRANMVLSCSELWLNLILPPTQLPKELFLVIMSFFGADPKCKSDPWTVVGFDPVRREWEYRLTTLHDKPLDDDHRPSRKDDPHNIVLFPHVCYKN